jgi:hypothetical protein
MIVFVDIDETICVTPPSREYNKSRPITENIGKINELYDEGHQITYWTARGTTTGVDYRELTKKQFEQWGVKYHELHFGKPVYDIFIDDKNINSKTFFESTATDD